MHSLPLFRTVTFTSTLLHLLLFERGNSYRQRLLCRHLLYPEQFNDINFEQKSNDIFKFFLGVDGYLSKLEAAGAGYGKVTLVAIDGR